MHNKRKQNEKTGIKRLDLESIRLSNLHKEVALVVCVRVRFVCDKKKSACKTWLSIVHVQLWYMHEKIFRCN